MHECAASPHVLATACYVTGARASMLLKVHGVTAHCATSCHAIVSPRATRREVQDLHALVSCQLCAWPRSTEYPAPCTLRECASRCEPACSRRQRERPVCARLHSTLCLPNLSGRVNHNLFFLFIPEKRPRHPSVSAGAQLHTFLCTHSPWPWSLKGRIFNTDPRLLECP